MNNKKINKKIASKYWIYGRRAVASALNNKNRILYKIIATKDGVKALQELTESYPYARSQLSNLSIEEHINNKEIDKIINLGQGAIHQGVAAFVAKLPQPSIEKLIISTKNPENRQFMIILDKLSCTNNAGAIMRTAEAFGAQAIITTKDGSIGESGALAKTSCGSLEKIPLITITNLVRTCEKLKKLGYIIVGLSSDNGIDITKYTEKLDTKLALILGNEEKGLRRLTINSCDLIFKIPISDSSGSINVSAAAAIAMYHVTQIAS